MVCSGLSLSFRCNERNRLSKEDIFTIHKEWYYEHTLQLPSTHYRMYCSDTTSTGRERQKQSIAIEGGNVTGNGEDVVILEVTWKRKVTSRICKVGNGDVAQFFTCLHLGMCPLRVFYSPSPWPWWLRTWSSSPRINRVEIEYRWNDSWMWGVPFLEGWGIRVLVKILTRTSLSNCFPWFTQSMMVGYG